MPIHIVRFLVALTIVALASSAMAGKPNPQNRRFKKTVLPAGGDLCLGVPDCVTRRSSVEVVGAGQQLAISVSCGGGHPHAWHWDAQSHGHLQSTLQERTPARVTVLTENVATIDGAATLLVGCSTEPFDAVRAAARRPRSAEVRHRELLGWPDPGGSVCDVWSIPGESSPAVPECIPVVQPPTAFDNFLQSRVTEYPCPADHPYFWPPHYTWDSACFSCVDWTDTTEPTGLRLQCTLWCSARSVVVTAACSKVPFDDGCHDPVVLTSDPNCPQSNELTHCAGIPPVCFITWNEQCTHGPYAGYSFSCTADNGFVFCDGCNGP